MMSADLLVVIIILLALIFTYTNGFQDGSSVVACPIASRALNPIIVIIISVCFEIFGALLGGSAVASTIESITSYPKSVFLLPILASSLSGAILWNYITRLLHFPSSSTHALVGGLIGSLLIANGNIIWGSMNLIHPSGVGKVILSLMAAPIISFIAGYCIYIAMTFLLKQATWSAEKVLKSAQYFTVSALAFGHGANDPQKSMAIILLALYAVHSPDIHGIPLPIRLASAIAIAFGVISIVPGIVKRVGTGIYKLRTLHSFVAQLSSACVIIGGSLIGGPVSASQVISSSIIGVGSAARIKSVHWLVAREILLAWFLTIPCSGILSSLFYLATFK
jgi:PiT family inorganic phosphate transporter